MCKLLSFLLLIHFLYISFVICLFVLCCCDPKSKEVYRKRLERMLQQNNTIDVWPGMKKITGFKMKEDQTDESLEGDNEPNVYFNRISFYQHSSGSSPASSTIDLIPYLYPHPPSHTSIMSPSTSVMDLNTALPTSSPKSEDLRTLGDS